MILGSVQITHSVQTSVSVFRMLNYFQVPPDSYLFFPQASLAMFKNTSVKIIKIPTDFDVKFDGIYVI